MSLRFARNTNEYYAAAVSNGEILRRETRLGQLTVYAIVDMNEDLMEDRRIRFPYEVYMELMTIEHRCSRELGVLERGNVEPTDANLLLLTIAQQVVFFFPHVRSYVENEEPKTTSIAIPLTVLHNAYINPSSNDV